MHCANFCLTVSLWGVSAVAASAATTPFTNFGTFDTPGDVFGGIGLYSPDRLTWHTGDVANALPGWDHNFRWDWNARYTGNFSPVDTDPLVLSAPFGSTSTIFARDDAGDTLGTLSLAGTGVLTIDLNPGVSLVAANSSQIMTPYSLVETYAITAKTGTFSDLASVADWSTEVRCLTARRMIAGQDQVVATTNPPFSHHSTFVMRGSYEQVPEPSSAWLLGLGYWGWWRGSGRDPFLSRRIRANPLDIIACRRKRGSRPLGGFLSLVAAVLACLLNCGLLFSQDSVYFVDDFHDGDMVDGNPVSWTPRNSATGTIVDGQVQLRVPSGQYGGLSTPVSGLGESYSLRTRTRTLDQPSSFGFLYLGVNWSNPGRDYWGGVGTDGVLQGGLVDTQNIIVTRASGGSGLDPFHSAINLQFDFVGRQVRLTGWTEGTPKPGIPQAAWLEAEPPQSPFDVHLGVTPNANGSLTGVFDFFELAPGPTSADPDIDGNGLLSATDLNVICTGARTIQLVFDMNLDNVVDFADVQVFLDAARILPGDTNFDRQVGFADFLQLAANYEARQLRTPWTSGDFDCDGWVRFSDFLILADNFDKSASGAIATKVEAVPEPSSAWMLGIVLLGLTRSWRVR